MQLLGEVADKWHFEPSMDIEGKMTSILPQLSHCLRCSAVGRDQAIITTDDRSRGILV